MLGLLESGDLAGQQLESKHVDLKEEAGRRMGIEAQPGAAHNEAAAKVLAAEAACMANTDHGGALIVGVADDGTLTGTNLETEWLRRRIFELTQRQLTVIVRESNIHGMRILILKSPEAVEPIAVNKRISWRVADSCVEIDAGTWRERRYLRVDWSAQPSGLPAQQARDVAVARARDYLRAAGDPRSVELAGLATPELLTRLNVMTSTGELTNAGAIAFVGRINAPGLDYIRRDDAGGDSRQRVRLANVGLIEELYEVERSAQAFNQLVLFRNSFVVGQLRRIPELAIRELIVNGCVHRDWNNPEATVVEHVGDTVTVTSPGGFADGVTSTNLLTHPSTSRNRSLVDLFATLRVAERQGIGIDMVTREMLRMGQPRPEIDELDGLRVRARLSGSPHEPWLRWLHEIQPVTVTHSLNPLLLLRRMVDQWWIDGPTAAPILQTSPATARQALMDLAQATYAGEPLISVVPGTDEGSAAAWCLRPAARRQLEEHESAVGLPHLAPSRAAIALSWAQARRRISTTELATIVGAQPTNVGNVLKSLERQGLLVPSRPGRRGPGFFYRPSPTDPFVGKVRE